MGDAEDGDLMTEDRRRMAEDRGWGRSLVAWVEADAALGRLGLGRGVEEREEFLDDIAQDEVVLEKLPVDLGEPLEDDGVGHELVAHANEGADNVDAHLHGSRAAQDRGGHDLAMFG